MAQEINLLEMIGLKEAAKQTLESEDLFVADARERYAYEDDKRTDKVVGTVLTLQVERDTGNPLSSHVFDLQTDQVMDVEKLLDKSVSVHIDDVRVWAFSRRNSTYAEPRVTLRGTITVEE